jgi:hypothetical protein
MGQIMDTTYALYSQMGARWRGNPHNHWKFPSGSYVRLGYMSEDKHVQIYQGNPYTYLGVDESTHQTERRIRRILPWLASTDPSLRVRARFATNPGDVGADWHMALFLRKKCPVHFPEESVEPGRIYAGDNLRWPSDKVPVLKTVSFIPASVRDNPFYGQEKIDALKTQEAAIAERLLTGCWCALSGRYFDFLTPDYKLRFDDAKEEWWHRHFISIDYGYGASWAAAGLYFVSEPSIDFPEGRMFKVAEMVRGGDPTEQNPGRRGSEDFAHEVVEHFVRRNVGGKRPQFEYVCFDPANDAHIGTGKSNMDIMSEVFTKEGIPSIKAAKDRVGNAQQSYRMLKKGQLVICDTAPITFASFGSRMHDPKLPGAVLKVEADPKDDLYDETTYIANTYFSSSEKPREIADLEKLKKMREAGLDEHSIWIHQERMRMDREKEDPNIYIGHRRLSLRR